MAIGHLLNAAGRKPVVSAGTSRSMVGTASGIGALTSTTVLFWVRQAIPNAASIPLRKAGLFSPAPGNRNAPAGQWKRWTSFLSGGTTTLSSSWTRRSTHRTWIQAISKDTFRGYGRTAGSIPMRRSGPRCLCRTRRRRPGVGASADDQPDKSCEITRRDRGVQRRALCRRCGRLRGPSAHRAGWMDLVHGFGRVDVPAYRGITSEAAPGSRQAVHRAVPA
jgi:hypothetical protein